VESKVQKPDAAMKESIETAISGIGASIRNDAQLYRKINESAGKIVLSALPQFAPVIKKMIEKTVSGWSESQIVSTLEPALEGPAVHPHQRHDRRRFGGVGDLCAVVGIAEVLNCSVNEILCWSRKRQNVDFGTDSRRLKLVPKRQNVDFGTVSTLRFLVNC